MSQDSALGLTYPFPLEGRAEAHSVLTAEMALASSPAPECYFHENMTAIFLEQWRGAGAATRLSEEGAWVSSARHELRAHGASSSSLALE